MDTVETPELMRNEPDRRLPDGYEVIAYKSRTIAEEKFVVNVEVGRYWSEQSISAQLNRFHGVWKVVGVCAMPSTMDRVQVRGVRTYEVE